MLYDTAICQIRRKGDRYQERTRKKTALHAQYAAPDTGLAGRPHRHHAALPRRAGAGDKNPSIDVLQKLCGELNCSADYLLGLSDSKSYRPLGEERVPVMPSGSGNSSDVMRLIAERNISSRDLKLALDLVRTIQDGKEND